ncbi:MAG: histidinol phosphate phosphatase domain-containing protein [Methanobrevibacter arboriphilus]|uniref:Histidinol phosphate phosphatase domain-containing protein n=2 Tax=Methanobrevibacter arboriphilus TaxID=39441 RepID=A0A843AD89_METAZ|nr:histidinol phosphate phosphatase domain-containing protein [Methanobrevibacter arboriphilus]MBF4468982.1 histidinol phosphate phosphatase domain-containing protein [Methanobrevibacter arboriphilus]MCC7562182.1 histidinol phosphate phosphatase domain-containing protein [Methanobrevibacter arboriphilus]BBL61421.1 PHP domain-containing protein [Methanobrevibacter arboriphilus]GLI11246.1 PHP domain-containing protein [Methanobrevibacter arboriphilus]
MNKRIDLHMHSLFSDGELLPSELARRAAVLNHETIAITDHIDSSNISSLSKLAGALDDINENWDINVVPGAEITHVPIEVIDNLALKAREFGAKIIVVHGETLSEPVIPGTNLAAVQSENVDILAHPGLITHEEAEIAKDNNIFLEISARAGHSLANGHVAKVACDVGADLVIDTDAHAPNDLITFEKAKFIGLGAGLSEKQVDKALIDNPIKILKKRNII